MLQQDAEKVTLLTRPTLPRRDAPFPMRRSRIVQILNGDPAASLTRRRAQTWCSLFVAPCAPEGTPPVPRSLRPCWTDFLSILFLPSANMVARPSPILLVPEHSQRSLAENPVGAGKPHDQREQHREEEADPKHLWV